MSNLISKIMSQFFQINFSLLLIINLLSQICSFKSNSNLLMSQTAFLILIWSLKPTSPQSAKSGWFNKNLGLQIFVNIVKILFHLSMILDPKKSVYNVQGIYFRNATQTTLSLNLDTGDHRLMLILLKSTRVLLSNQTV